MQAEILSALLQSQPDPSARIDQAWAFDGAVVVCSRRAGTCVLPPGASCPGQDQDRAQGLVGRCVVEVVQPLLQSERLVERALGLAALDSALSVPAAAPRLKVSELLFEQIREDQICFIGHFPRADRWRERGLRVDVVELVPGPGDVPWALAGPTLARAQVVLITGQTLVNGTLGQVLEATPQARLRVLQGPSVPMAPSLLDLGVQVLGCSFLEEVEVALDYWRQGGRGMRGAPPGAITPVCLLARPGPAARPALGHLPQ